MEPNEKKVMVMVVEEKEIKKPERKIVTVECSSVKRYGETETHVLSLTPEQYRLMQWLSDNDFFDESFEWYDGKPEVEIEEI